MKNYKAKRGFEFSFVLISLIVVTFVVSFVGLLQPSAAEASVQIVPPTCTDADGCSICEIVEIFTNAADLVGIFLSSIALLMFILGGFMWIFSAGQAERVEKGKKIILGTLTGLVIVFLAWFAVNVIVRVASSSGGNAQGGLGTSTYIFSRGWWDQRYCQPATPTTCKNYSIGTLCGYSGDTGCGAIGSGCTCYRSLDPAGDNNLCAGDDVSSIGSATYTNTGCFCASQCNRYKAFSGRASVCINKASAYTGHESNYTPVTGVTCVVDTEICVIPVTP